MNFDVFCSLSQTPRAGGHLPSHAQVLNEFLDQAVLADELGFDCVWAAESHFSSEVQKRHARPVVTHWTGEIGLNTDICQLAAQVFPRTRRIEVGSAIMNIVANGGPIPAAEKVATALAWHGLDEAENRRLHLGFATGRFDFINATTGIRPRTSWEEVTWRQVKTSILKEASEIFVRLLEGETISSDDVPEHPLERRMFPSPADFERLVELAGAGGGDGDGTVSLPRRWTFESTRIIPEFRRPLLQLVAGTHDPDLPAHLNRFAPVRVFNLSITPSSIIDQTHERMAACYHPSGGPWLRSYMPRTVLVFLNAEPALDAAARRARAREHAETALAAYWRALDGTIDESKVLSSADNAVVGGPEDIAEQLAERYHPDDRLMLWFDFFAQSGEQVTSAMRQFQEQVVPLLSHRGGGG